MALDRRRPPNSSAARTRDPRFPLLRADRRAGTLYEWELFAASACMTWIDMLTEAEGGRIAMMMAQAKDFDDYLAAVPEPARTTLEKLHRTIRAAVPDAT
jgi:hypothetical protein